MFRTYNSEEVRKLRPEEDLQNISFFQIGKSYDLSPKRKLKHFPYAQFSSWSQKDQQQFLNFSYHNQPYQAKRQKSADSIFKKTPLQRMRFSNSVTFHTKKIDLGAKVSESISKLNFKQKSKSFYSPVKNLSQSQPRIQNKNKMKKLSNQILEQIKNDQVFKKDQKFENQIQLQTQPSYNIINYPISTYLIRKRKFKKLEKFPFPSLASRLNK